MKQRMGAEHTAYDPDQVKQVSRVLDRHQGPERAATEKRLALEAGIEERRFRAILADFDGTRWLLGKVTRSKAGDGGLFLARTQEEATALTAEIASKLETLTNRHGRRVAYIEQARRVEQLDLFGSKVA